MGVLHHISTSVSKFIIPSCTFLITINKLQFLVALVDTCCCCRRSSREVGGGVYLLESIDRETATTQ